MNNETVYTLYAADWLVSLFLSEQLKQGFMLNVKSEKCLQASKHLQ